MGRWTSPSSPRPRPAVEADDKNWNPGKKETGLIWFELWWYGQWQTSPTGPSAASSEAVTACPESPMEAGGRLVVHYDGVIKPGDTPKKSNFTCVRYDTDGTKWTETGPMTATWSSHHSCEKNFPISIIGSSTTA